MDVSADWYEEEQHVPDDVFDSVRTDVDPRVDTEAARREAERIARESDRTNKQEYNSSANNALHQFELTLKKNAMAIPSDDQFAGIVQSTGKEFRTFTATEFDEADFSIEYIVNKILVSGQPAVIGGPSKALKTSVGLDLAISLASGSNFLGQYEVTEPQRVLFLSAESGMAAIRCTARRICKSRGLRLSELPISFGDWVPFAKDKLQLAGLRYHLNRHQPQVAFIDPVYQVLDGEDQASVGKMGQQLALVCDQVREFMATPVLIHHATRTSTRVINRQPLEISDLTGAGVAEYFRQWILINRREQWTAGNAHELWLSSGGSAGHASQWALSIDERREDDRPTDWVVELLDSQEVERKKVDAADDAKERKARATVEKHCQAVKKAWRGRGKETLTRNAIASASGLNDANCSKALGHLIVIGEVEFIEGSVQKRNGSFDGYRLKSDNPDNSDSRGQLSGFN